MSKKKLLEFLPHLVAIVLFFAISSAFFSPLFNGYDLRQNDIKTFTGMSKEIADFRAIYDEEPLWTNSMFGGMPAYQISVKHGGNWIKKLDRVVKFGLRGPIGALFMAMLGFYILALCLKINPWIGIVGAIGYGLTTIFILYLAAGHTSKMYAVGYMAPVLGGLLITLKGKYLRGAAITAFFLALHLSMNHLQMTYYLIYLLLFVGIAYGISLILKGKVKQLGLATGVLILAAAIGALPTVGNLMLTSEYSSYTTRGETELSIAANGEIIETNDGLNRDYILEYNFGLGELFSILIPNVKGGSTERIKDRKGLLSGVDREFKKTMAEQSTYWGEQRFSGGPFYFGAILVFLAFLGFFTVKNPIKWGLLAVILLSFVLSIKDYGALGDFFLEKVPMFSKFRDSKMMLVLVQLSIPLMAILFLDGLFKAKENLQKVKIPLFIGGGVFILFMILSYVSPSLFFDFEGSNFQASYSAFLDQVKDEGIVTRFFDDLVHVRQTIFKADVGRSLLLVVLSFGLVLLFVFDKLNEKLIIPIIGILVLFDLFGVDRRYLDDDKKGGQYTHYMKKFDKKYPFDATPADLSILSREKGAISNFDQSVADIIKTKTEGYKKSEINKFKKRIDAAAAFGVLGLNTDYRVLKYSSLTQDSKTSYFHKSLGGYHGAKLKKYQELIDFHINKEMQSLGKVTTQEELTAALSNIPVINMLNTKYLILNEASPAIPNSFANGNAWFVDEVILAANADEEIKTLGTIDLKNKAVVDSRYSDLVLTNSTADPTSKIDLITYLPNHLTYESNAQSERTAIFSEIYYEKGWKAYIDDTESPYFRANYTLRGMKIPAGNHKIEFIYAPEAYKKGETFAMLGSILVLLLVFGAIFFGFKGSSTEEKTIA